jgi:hypothetical protein
MALAFLSSFRVCWGWVSSPKAISPLVFTVFNIYDHIIIVQIRVPLILDVDSHIVVILAFSLIGDIYDYVVVVGVYG